jgi:hypothetical protein
VTAAAIMQAHVSGPLGQALAVIGGEIWLFEAAGRRRPSHNDIRFFFDHGLEVRPIGQPIAADLEGILDEETRKFRALHGVLYGLDADLDDATRSHEMRRASGLLSDPAVAEFVNCRFLQPPDTTAWDIAHALELARRADLPLIERLYAIVDSKVLGQVEDTIRDWAIHEGYGSARRAEVVEQAYDDGLVAAVARAAHDDDRPHLGTLLFDAETARGDRRLVEYLIQELIRPMASSRTETGNAAAVVVRHIETSVLSRVVAAMDEQHAQVRRTKPISLKGATSKPPMRGAPRIPFGSLVEQGLIAPGTTIYDRQRRVSAVVEPDGSLSMGHARGSIHKIGALAQNAPSCNGWTFWHFERGGSLLPLEELRVTVTARLAVAFRT